MGNRFTLFVPRKSDGVFQEVYGGQVKVRAWARPLFRNANGHPILEEDENGYGRVTDVRCFTAVVYSQLRDAEAGLDISSDDYWAERYAYWSHLWDICKIASAFLDHGVEVHIDVC